MTTRENPRRSNSDTTFPEDSSHLSAESLSSLDMRAICFSLFSASFLYRYPKNRAAPRSMPMFWRDWSSGGADGAPSALVTAWSVAMERPSAAFAAKAPKTNMRAVRKGACASDRILVRLLYFSSLFLGLDEGSSDAATRTVRVTARDCRRRRFVIVALVVVARVIAGVTRRPSARDDAAALGRAYVVADMFTAKADIVVGIDLLSHDRVE
mmetsp:Transcript_10562/g.42628  ORF Transcript_10562/g.42628 Transcript_10562/m.42628 type:complete len:211 (-) Transcript_10562:28-660(-)